jgi:hypothetical protein
MKNNILASILALSLLVAVGGCSTSKYNLASLAGLNVRDLEKAKEQGVERTFNFDLDTAFNETLKVLNSEGLTIYQSNLKKGYIVAMGFKEQVDTTRIGIFFEAGSENSTKIILSSLSSTALVKAEKIIFGGLSKVSP